MGRRVDQYIKTVVIFGTLMVGLSACTQESQNQLGRSIQNWTGTNGVVEVYSGGQVVKRFIQVDKLSTAYGTNDGQARPYRFGYGVIDDNMNYQKDVGEKKVYFELGEYTAEYIFFENPKD
jgi:hypothetical protein